MFRATDFETHPTFADCADSDLQKQLSAGYVLITLDINFLDNEGDSQESKKFSLNNDTPN